MTDMIQRVAKAIYEERNGNGCKPWGLLPKAHKDPYMADADVAITMVSIPTKQMIESGVLAYNLTGIANGIINTAEDHVLFIFSAMILGTSPDADLKGVDPRFAEGQPR